MAALCWTAATAALLMIAEISLIAGNQNQLASAVQEFLNRYTPSYTDHRGTRREPMFSVVVSIPYNRHKKMYDMSEVTDSSEEVRETILKCDVYTGTRVVAATVLRWPNVLTQCPNERVQWRHVLRLCPKEVQTWADVQRRCPEAALDGTADHAEYRTLQNFNTLLNNRNRNDLMIFYVRASPCDQRCTSQTHRWSILNSINQILNWKHHAVVFSHIFKPRDGTVIPEADLRESLVRLGTYRGLQGSIGLENIFRCNRQSTYSSEVQCTSCSMGDQVTPYCFLDALKPGTNRGRGRDRQSGGRGKKKKNTVKTEVFPPHKAT